MSIQEHLTAFDGWLSHRIAEAHDAHQDLAFRDVAEAGQMARAWEYALLEPGQARPSGEGWSVYRLQGVWPDFPAQDAEPAAAVETHAPDQAGRRPTLLAALAKAVFGQGVDGVTR
jgi:hypothetical protein